VKLLFGEDEKVAKFVASLIPGTSRGFGNNRAVGIVNDAGDLIGGVVFHNWDPESGVIEISASATDKRWFMAARQFMYDFAFEACGCQMIVQRNDASNEYLNRQMRRFGYTEHRIARLRGRDEDGIVFTFTDDQWARHPMNNRKV
jgi:RimJ/RimL family protein N-acetyltransferase